MLVLANDYFQLSDLPLDFSYQEEGARNRRRGTTAWRSGTCASPTPKSRIS